MKITKLLLVTAAALAQSAGVYADSFFFYSLPCSEADYNISSGRVECSAFGQCADSMDEYTVDASAVANNCNPAADIWAKSWAGSPDIEAQSDGSYGSFYLPPYDEYATCDEGEILWEAGRTIDCSGD